MTELQPAMKLTELKIEVSRWGDNKGQYSGVVVFEGRQSDIRLKLTPEMVDKIFLIAADAIIEQAREAARAMTAQVIEQKVETQKAHGLFFSSAAKSN